MMHVVLATGVYPPETGGPATFVPALSADWCARGWDVTVVTYGDERTCTSSTWKVEVVSRAGGVFVRYLRYAWRVWKLARGAQWVFLQGPFSDGLPGTIGAWLAECPTVLRVPGDFAWEGVQREQTSSARSLEAFLVAKKPFKWRLIFWLESLVARRARCVITPSAYLQRLVAAWGVPTERGTHIYNTVALEQHLPSRTELRRQLQLEEGNTILLTNARGVPWKRFDFLLEVLCELPVSYELVHIGEGPELAHWKALTKELGLIERVRFQGRVSYIDVQRWARAADAFVLPSLYEGFPHVAIEAACLGTPTFVSDQGGNPEAEQMYPGRVRVLPYGDRTAWKEALLHVPASMEPIPPKPFSEVADEYTRVIQAGLGMKV